MVFRLSLLSCCLPLLPLDQVLPSHLQVSQDPHPPAAVGGLLPSRPSPRLRLSKSTPVPHGCSGVPRSTSHRRSEDGGLDTESQGGRGLISLPVCMYVCICMYPQLGKHCQELLMGVATNCSTHQSEDLKVIESLLAVRLKTKLFSNQFVGCIRYAAETNLMSFCREPRCNGVLLFSLLESSYPVILVTWRRY